jgi:amino acid transporter
LIKVGNGSAPVGHLTPSLSWFNPIHDFTFSGFMVGFTLMLFIYWGWDTAVSVNEETKDAQTIPGRAAVLSTLVLLATYALVILATQSYAGIGTKGVGLQNAGNEGDVLSVLGHSIFGSSGWAVVPIKLLLLMVLSSAAASTQTTILPTARTTLSMAVYKAIPSTFGRIHKKYLTPTVSTVAMGGISIVLYVAMNYLTSGGSVIVDSVSALGVMIAFYYGLTGFCCVWFYRKSLTESARSFWIRGVLPFLGGVILWFCMFWSFWYYWNNANSDTRWTLPGTHRVIGGVFILDVGVLLLGVVLMYVYKAFRPAYFRGEVLNRDTPTRVPEDIGTPVGLFGIDPFAEDGNPATN